MSKRTIEEALKAAEMCRERDVISVPYDLFKEYLVLLADDYLRIHGILEAETPHSSAMREHWRQHVLMEKELNDAHYLLDEHGVPSRAYSELYGGRGLIVPRTRSLSERIKLLIQTVKGLTGE